MSSFKASATTPRTKSVFKHAVCAAGLSLAVSVLSTQAHAGCQYVVTNDWGSGFTAAIKITNSGTTAINGWTVSWQYSGNNRVSNAWNATLTGSNPYSATNAGFNTNIPVGQTVEFGFQGTKSTGAAEVPVVTGTGCGTTSSAASTSRSSSSVSVSTSTSTSRSSSSVSVSTSRSSSSVSSSRSSSSTSSSSSSSAASTSVAGVIVYENFEGGAVNTQPSGWQNFIGWVANNSNTPSGSQYALIDNVKSYSGSNSIHFKGGAAPAQIIRALPSGTQRLYTRAYVNMSVAMGNIAGDNHEHIFGTRRTIGDASQEIRAGMIKGVLGVNQVQSDNISPKMDKWYSGFQMAANTWYCVETAYLADQAYDTFHMWVDGNLVHTVDSADDWNNGALEAGWMDDRLNFVFFGFHSFSNRNADVWMDELVVSTQPIGCGTVNPGSSSSSVSSSSSSSSVSSILSSSSRSSSSVSSSLSSSSSSNSSSSSASVSSIASNAAWTLNTTDSYLNIVTTKNTHVVEAHNFTTISADISTAGVATLTIDLNSINTGVALRDQRMRDLLFETATYPTSTITVSVPSTLISGLSVGQSTQTSITGTLNLHGVSGTVTTTVSVQKLSNSKVIVQSLAPVLVKAGDYSLTAGVEALRAAVGIASISVAVPVDFALVFDAR